MRDIYSCANCCIAATAAKDGDDGLFFNRNPRDLLPIRADTSRARIYGQKTNEPLSAYIIDSVFVTDAVAIDDAPLNQRAWVAQERYLSSGTIHFTQELLFWECHERVTSEQYPWGVVPARGIILLGYSADYTLKSRVDRYRDCLSSSHWSSSDTGKHEIFSSIHEAWCQFRKTYSSLNLTKEEDILVALNGVAQAVAELTNDFLVAGLWRDRLIEDLCWRRLTQEGVYSTDAPSRPSIWRAPTWSWASINRAVEGRVLWWEHKSYAERIREMAVIEDMIVDQSPSGELADASLKLKCRLMPISPPDSVGGRWAPYDVVVFLDDCTINNAEDLGDELSLVVLRQYTFMVDGGVQGILVLPSRIKTGSYERVGYFELTAQDLFRPERSARAGQILENVLDAHHKAQETTIELI